MRRFEVLDELSGAVLGHFEVDDDATDEEIEQAEQAMRATLQKPNRQKTQNQMIKCGACGQPRPREGYEAHVDKCIREHGLIPD